MQYLRKDEDIVCLECKKNQNKYIWKEVRHEALVEKLKDGSCRATLRQQEEDHFEVDDMMKKIDNEHKLDTKE